MENTKIFIAIPCLNEIDFIDKTITCIKNQSYRNFKLFICVNQPEKYHFIDEFKHIVENNLKTIEYIKSITEFEVELIDKSSLGKGWDENSYGVGWARKLLFDAISKEAISSDIIVSLDADTVFENNYFQTIIYNFHKYPFATALSVPYYHKLVADNQLNTLLLRYEIYVRYYLINLFRINSPYAFTALGSAIAFPFWAYQKIRGLAPKFSGEDFYLLQKLRKAGKIIQDNDIIVYPATRYSNRVFFGTGPALIKGKNGDWSSYPIFHYDYFNKIEQVYKKLPNLFSQNEITELDNFIIENFNMQPNEFWAYLRKNNIEIKRFIHAFHTKFDGLRILQFLRFQLINSKLEFSEEEVLLEFLNNFYPNFIPDTMELNNLSFANSSVKLLDDLRNVLYNIESFYRKNYLSNNTFDSKHKAIEWKYLN